MSAQSEEEIIGNEGRDLRRRTEHLKTFYENFHSNLKNIGSHLRDMVRRMTFGKVSP